MTPKEKAAELIVNYQLKCKSLNYDEAKECALIAVDEIYKLPLKVGQYLDNEESIEMYYAFWEDVKEETGNLCFSDFLKAKEMEQEQQGYSIDDLKEAFTMGRTNATIKDFNEQFKKK